MSNITHKVINGVSYIRYTRETNYDIIDKEIRNYIHDINEYDFVASVLSCQGHYIKKPRKAVIYYESYEIEEDGIMYNAIYDNSRVLFPYVLLNFPDPHIANMFFRFFIKLRKEMYNGNIRLYIMSERKNKYMEKIHGKIKIVSPAIIVSKFGHTSVSITATTNPMKHSRYNTHKIKENTYIKRVRGHFFRSILMILEKMNKSLNR